MKKLINHISNEISDDLKEYNTYLIESIDSKVGLINKILKYVIKTKGKQFRPILCLLASRLNGKPNNNTYLSASTVEILHVATLLHDIGDEIAPLYHSELAASVLKPFVLPKINKGIIVTYNSYTKIPM